MRLRYTGPLPVSFMTCGVGEVQPGATFEVPDQAAPGFLARRDVEPAPQDPPPGEDPPPPLPSRSRKKTPPAAVPEPQPAAAPGDALITEEDSRGLSDDH